ncbi:MAG: 2-C-methyl-D-erythritol 2,4-cyclodiphosphate synthase [Defluviitaleaceae bacterium]|nr:2-C-methyl-D-erythritol 2,4-cyclodiphosphate synthase [Defluviitaleaceae bacterium]
MSFRIGIGYDVHKLAKNQKLVIGGVTIPYDYGLLGHSDADVLTHAIMDAMLGALALGDIGKLFPDSDLSYKGISSLALLEKVNNMIIEKGYKIVNIDSVIVAEMPKFAPYINDIRGSLCRCLDLDVDLISVKATTEEELGFTGQRLGIAAKAVVLVGG